MQSLAFLLATLIASSHALSVTECTSNSLQCFNGGICIQVKLNLTSTLQLCRCQTGYTGSQCTQLSSPCSPDPCGSNGYCNPNTDAAEDSYFCRCKPGFTGPHCEANINECLEAQCQNGGLCIDGVNSYECECPWPYAGRYCLTKLTCKSQNVCQNGGICKQTVGGPSCTCPPGFSGNDCSNVRDQCLEQQPCRNNGQCFTEGSGYRCVCSQEFKGKDCELFDECSKKPCHNNATCVSGDNEGFRCECPVGYTGATCQSRVECLGSSCDTGRLERETTTSSVDLKGSSSNNNVSSNTNGSFVLVVNVAPSEFKQRKPEIISEFERQFGVLMLIKKDAHNQEMIHEFRPHNSPSETVWTKVYFILIFACLHVQTNSLCLQSKVNDLNNNAEILKAMQQNANLLPNYISNITYEAYSSKAPTHGTNTSQNPDSQLTTVLVICLAISLLVGISLAFTVLIRQNATRKTVKAPVWFPPPGTEVTSNKQQAFDYSNDYETIKHVKKQPSMFHKAFDDFSHLFTKPNRTLQESPDSGHNSNGSSDLYEKPTKARRIKYGTTPDSPECYPSPPESLPGSDHQHTNTVNLRGGSYGLTPLMVFILGRSKLQHAVHLQGSQPNFKSINDGDIVETFVSSGAELDSQNHDGETALHLAVRCGLVNVCERLVRRGAALHIPDNYGRNVLHSAAGSNQLAIARIILEHCAQQLANSACLDDRYDLVDAKSADDLGDTPLIIAARLNHNKMIALLLEYSAAVNAADHEGRSALHWCAKVNNAAGAALLIQAGANVNMQDHDEKTPLSAALVELNTREVADLLIKCDAFVAPDDEARYRKMATIGEALGHRTPGVSNELVAKLKQDNLNTAHELVSKKTVTATDKRQKGAGTKRKLSDTFTETSMVPQQPKRIPSRNDQYTPLTPSPPLNSNYFQQYGGYAHQPVNHGFTTEYHPVYQQSQGQYSYYSEGYAAYF